MIAWVVGILVALATTDPAAGPGFGWFTLTTISALDGLIVAFLVYLVLLPLRRSRGQDATASPSIDQEQSA